MSQAYIPLCLACNSAPMFGNSTLCKECIRRDDDPLAVDAIFKEIVAVDEVAATEAKPDELIAAFEAIEPGDLEAVFELFRTLVPPSTTMDRHLIDQHLRKVLKKKGVEGPAVVIKAWFRDADDGEGTVAEAEKLIPVTEEVVDEVDGRKLLEELVEFYDRYIYAPYETHLAVALYTLATHGIELWEIMATLCFRAADKECGKSTYLSLLWETAHRPFVSSNVTGPGLFRTVDALHPTLLIDEGDAVIEGDDQLRSILKASHMRKMAKTVRMAGENRDKIQVFDVFGAKAYTAVGQVKDDQIASRTIFADLPKMPPFEFRTDARMRDVERAGAGLRGKCGKFIRDHALTLRSKEVPKDNWLRARDADNWEPLLAIATVIGEDVYRAAVKAATVPTDDNTSRGEMLLKHIQEAFADEPDSAHVASEDLLHALVARDDAPWAHYWENDLKAGNLQKAASSLAHKLKPYGIRSTNIRQGDRVVKGYKRADLEPIWDTYVRPKSGETPQDGRYIATPQVRGGLEPFHGQEGVAAPSLAAEGSSGVAADSGVSAVSVIAEARRNGHSDKAIAASLNVGKVLPPNGTKAWSAFSVGQIAPDEGDAVP